MVPADVKNEFTQLDKIRPFPTAASRILELANSPDCDVREMTRLLECEPSVAGKIIAMANSPLYGVAREITSISHSIVRLGFNSVSQLAVSVYSKELFEAGDPAQANERSLIFRHSIAIGSVAKVLAANLKMAPPDQAFLAGVLHDIGRLLFFDVVAEEYVQLLKKFPSGETTESEQKKFGTDHATVGNQCGQKWGLPAVINDAILHHHDPVDEVTQPVSKIIILANYFARSWGVGFNGNDMPAIDESCERLVAEEDRESLAETCHQHFGALEAICGVAS